MLIEEKSSPITFKGVFICMHMQKRGLIALQEKMGEHWNPPAVVRWLGAESSNMGYFRSDPKATFEVPWKVPASSHTLKSWTAVLGLTFDFLRNSHN